MWGWNSNIAIGQSRYSFPEPENWSIKCGGYIAIGREACGGYIKIVREACGGFIIIGREAF